MWGVAKAVLRGKYATLDAYIRKEEQAQIDNLSFFLRKLEKGQNKPKLSRKEKQDKNVS